jgi:hypothetical protein
MRVTLWPKHLGLKPLVYKVCSLLRAAKSVTLFSGILNHAAECNASSFEEPGAVIPHAGICKGAVG